MKGRGACKEAAPFFGIHLLFSRQARRPKAGGLEGAASEAARGLTVASP